MEADWEVEIGGDAAVIDAGWPGLIDLRADPNRVSEIPEVNDLPALGEALLRLNDASSPVWTAKCDVWQVDEFDPDELDAMRQLAKEAVACYIDLLPRSSQSWDTTESAVAACQAICARLREAPLRCCRADLVVRRAFMGAETPDYGMTAYLTACGEAKQAATRQLGQALAVFADSVSAFGREKIAPTLQSKQTGE